MFVFVSNTIQIITKQTALRPYENRKTVLHNFEIIIIIIIKSRLLLGPARQIRFNVKSNSYCAEGYINSATLYIVGRRKAPRGRPSFPGRKGGEPSNKSERVSAKTGLRQRFIFRYIVPRGHWKYVRVVTVSYIRIRIARVMCLRAVKFPTGKQHVFRASKTTGNIEVNDITERGGVVCFSYAVHTLSRLRDRTLLSRSNR